MRISRTKKKVKRNSKKKVGRKKKVVSAGTRKKKKKRVVKKAAPSKKKKKKVSARTKKKVAKKKVAKKKVSKQKQLFHRISRQPPEGRRAAALKGWATRRANPDYVGKKPRRATEVEVAAVRAADREVGTNEQTRMIDMLAYFQQPHIKLQIQDRLISKGVLRPEWVEADESKILAQLIVAEQFGNFDQRAYELANEYDWNVQDVYELWHSPD